MSKVLFFLALLMWASISNALEITHYTVSATGIFHDVTVALENINRRAKVRCLIELNGKPVAKKDQIIDGVGTINIQISGGVKGKTIASCSELT